MGLINMIPILIRTKDRPHYLHTTLKSLMGTELYDGLIIISDDCSTDEITNNYLFTDKIVDGAIGLVSE